MADPALVWRLGRAGRERAPQLTAAQLCRFMQVKNDDLRRSLEGARPSLSLPAAARPSFAASRLSMAREPAVPSGAAAQTLPRKHSPSKDTLRAPCLWCDA